MTKQKFSTSQANMLTAALTLTNRAIEDHAAISAEMTTWDRTFLLTQRSRIQTAIQTLGANPIVQQKEATKLVKNMAMEAIRILRKIRNRMYPIINHRSTTESWLKNLGYPLLDQSRYDQEVLTRFLSTFVSNLSTTMEQTLVDGGIPSRFFSQIKQYNEDFSPLNADQENAKHNTTLINRARIHEYNAIYEYTITLSRIGRDIFSSNIQKRRAYTYGYILRRMNYSTQNINRN